MKLFTIYNFGTLILFIGLLWMMSPHATHNSVFQEPNHVTDILLGMVVALVGLLVMKKGKIRQIHQASFWAYFKGR